MSSCVVLVRPSKSRLMESKMRPYVLLVLAPFFFLPDDWYRVKMETPRVTRATTAYL